MGAGLTGVSLSDDLNRTRRTTDDYVSTSLLKLSFAVALICNVLPVSGGLGPSETSGPLVKTAGTGKM